MSVLLGNNLKLLRKRKKRSQEDVAQVIGVKRTSYTCYEIGSSEPTLDNLIQLSNYFRIGIDRLVRENLSKIPESKLGELERSFEFDIKGERLRVLATTVNASNEENIELVPSKARAGYTAGFSDPDFISKLPVFSLPFLDKNKKYRTFPIKGDSMPPVGEGAWVTGEFITDWTTIKLGTPCIVITKDDGIVFKLVFNKIEESGALLLCSTNPTYEPYAVAIEDILEIWKFVHYISPEMPEPSTNIEQLTRAITRLQLELRDMRIDLSK